MINLMLFCLSVLMSTLDSCYLYRILIIESSGSGKINALLNLSSHQQDIYKTYLYAKDPYAAK